MSDTTDPAAEAAQAAEELELALATPRPLLGLTNPELTLVPNRALRTVLDRLRQAEEEAAAWHTAADRHHDQLDALNVCDCDCQPGQPCLCPERDCYCGPCRVCGETPQQRKEDGRG